MAALSALVPYLLKAGFLSRSARTSNTILGVADARTWVDVTTGNFTQTFAAIATLGADWWCLYGNSSGTPVTLDPNSSEQIDSLTSFVVYPAEVRLLRSTGTAFETIILQPFSHVFTASGTFIDPPGYAYVEADLWGGGGSGGRAAGGYATGGGGGARVPYRYTPTPGTSRTVTIGAGGAAQAGNSDGVAGGQTIFDTIKANGGAAGDTNGTDTVTGAAGATQGVDGSASVTLSAENEGGDAGSISGGTVSDTTDHKLWGGAAGGSAGGGNARAGGFSINGGDGGAGSVTNAVAATAGSAPGGGGGGAGGHATVGASGAGADGQVRVRGIA